jgi:LDH2 family malate/lactate/ureidoglycolate dehydrogenase
MATSKRAWGQVRLANKYGTDLPADTFYNDKGEVTLNPKEAHSVMPFGDYKGFALALMVEILCGSLIGMDNMMIDTKSAGSNFGTKLQDRGGVILVIDPQQTSSLDAFKQANTELLDKIKATSPLKGKEIRIPGEEAGAKQAEKLKEGMIEIPEELWEEIKGL